MVTMKLDLGIDAQKFIQQVQLHNLDIEKQVQEGLDAAIESLSKNGVIQEMIKREAEKSILDSFSSFLWKCDLRKQIEKSISDKLANKINEYTDKVVDELAAKLNLSTSL